MMTDKLREAAQAALEWLKDERLNTWPYMEGHQFYADRDKQVKALEAALAEPEEKLLSVHRLDEWLKASLAEPDQEYICKCGLRVVPHRCKAGKEF